MYHIIIMGVCSSSEQKLSTTQKSKQKVTSVPANASVKPKVDVIKYNDNKNTISPNTLTTVKNNNINQCNLSKPTQTMNNLPSTESIKRSVNMNMTYLPSIPEKNTTYLPSIPKKNITPTNVTTINRTGTGYKSSIPVTEKNKTNNENISLQTENIDPEPQVNSIYNVLASSYILSNDTKQQTNKSESESESESKHKQEEPNVCTNHNTHLNHSSYSNIEPKSEHNYVSSYSNHVYPTYSAPSSYYASSHSSYDGGASSHTSHGNTSSHSSYDGGGSSHSSYDGGGSSHSSYDGGGSSYSSGDF